MNNNNKFRAKSLKLKATLCIQPFAFFLILLTTTNFLLLTTSVAQIKSSLQVDSINVKKITTELPNGINSDYILAVDNSGNIKKGMTIGDLRTPYSDASCGTIAAIGKFRDARDGNTYTVRNYGSAGCWMTQNLRYPVSGAYTAAATTIYILGANTSGTTIGINDMQRGDINIGTAYNINGTVRAPSLKNHFDTLGVLYNWNMAMTTYMGTTGSGTNPAPAVGTTTVSATQGICPAGWFLPSNQDWVNLITALRAAPFNITAGNEGTAMKTTIDMNGATQSPRGTNSVEWNGFLPGQVYNGNTIPNAIGTSNYNLTSSEVNSTVAYHRYLLSNNAQLLGPDPNVDKALHYFSVRCRKN